MNNFIQSNDDNSYYLININRVKYQYNKWIKYLKNIDVRYAVKSNPDKMIIRNLINLGSGFDCASKNEIKLVLSLSNNKNITNKIIFANPVKKYDDIKYAIDNKIYHQTFDSLTELIKIKNIDKDNKVLLYLRINVDDSYSVCRLNKKFGLNIDIQSNITEIITFIKENSMNLYGISFHVGSGCNNSIAYELAIQKSRQIYDILKEYDIDIKCLDIGGGFLSNDTHEYNFENASNGINVSLNKYFEGSTIKYIAEPGRFMCANSTTLVCNILAIKTEGSKKIYHIDESTYMGFNCIHNDHQINFIISVLDNNNKFIFLNNELVNTSLELYETQLNGCTCDSIDIINLNSKLPVLKMGYKLVFSNFGAYTYAANSNFNGMEPPIKKYITY
jgi:diaminopimelate decarboxylase